LRGIIFITIWIKLLLIGHHDLSRFFLWLSSAFIFFYDDPYPGTGFSFLSQFIIYHYISLYIIIYIYIYHYISLYIIIYIYISLHASSSTFPSMTAGRFPASGGGSVAGSEWSKFTCGPAEGQRLKRWDWDLEPKDG
jgi:hypothetical protein